MQATVGIPDEMGALVAKGAAWLIDRRDSERHLDDGAVLLASIADASTLNYASMSKNDRKRIRAILTELSNTQHRSWINLNARDREHGLFTLALIQQVLK